MGTPVAYLRKSRVIDERVGVSWEVQEGKVRELAAQHGDNGGRLLILSDWNISGRKGAAGRPGYRRLLEMIESGEASAIYGYNLARLSRSVQDLRALMALADAHHVPVRLVADQVDTSTATGRMLLTMLAAVDEMTADLASEHARDAVAARRARGDRIGHPFYGEKAGEDAGAVVQAYREAGSILGAARLLNRREVPTRMGGPWASITVRELLVRLGAYAGRTRPGAKPRAPFLLYGLLRCHCDHVMTGTRYQNGPQPLYTAYKCYKARAVPDHGPGTIVEKTIVAWVRDEIAHIDLGGDRAEAIRDDAAQRAALTARLGRASEEYVAGRWTRERRDREIAVVATEMDKLGDAVVVADLGDLDDLWTWAPVDANATLRAILERVTLGPDLRPTLALWRNPALRRACDDPACTHCPALRS
jgi:site-specific DNA recombinase